MELMGNRGFVHFVPLLVIAVVLAGSFGLLSRLEESRQKAAVGKVLSSSESGGDRQGSDSSGPSGGDSKSSDDKSDQSGSSTTDTSGSGPTGSQKIESRTSNGRMKIETSKDKTKVEVRTGEGRFETKIGEGKEETKIRTGNLRIEIKQEGERVVIKVKNEKNEEVEVEDEVKNKLLDEVENELEDDDIKLATGSAQLGFIQHGRKVRTNFPLSVNPQTGELFVSTPAGEKVVAILPDVAVENMIKAGILTRVIEEPEPAASPSPTENMPSASPPEGTAGASVAGAGIQLSQLGDNVVYIISGVNDQNFLGLVPVEIHLKTIVSAQDGSLVDVRESLLSRILDLFSV